MPSSISAGPSWPPRPALKYERMVGASTRRLPSTTIELTDCASATLEDATDTTPALTSRPPRTATLRASPRTHRTHNPMRYAPLPLAAAPVADWLVTLPGFL